MLNICQVFVIFHSWHIKYLVEGPGLNLVSSSLWSEKNLFVLNLASSFWSQEDKITDTQGR